MGMASYRHLGIPSPPPPNHMSCEPLPLTLPLPLSDVACMCVFLCVNV